MILTCPSCATRFALADSAFAAGPRKLRCAKCKHVWLAGADGAVLPEPPPPPAASAAARPAPESPSPGFEQVPPTATFAPPPGPPAPPPETMFKPARPLLAESPQQLSRRSGVEFSKPPLPAKSFLDNVEKAAGRLPRLPRRMAWAVLILLLTLLLVVLFLGRYKLAARFPALEDMYLSYGLIQPFAVDSFDVQLTQAEKCFISGRNMLCLAGTLTNKATIPMRAPTVYITALNGDGREFTDVAGNGILTWKVPAAAEKLLPNEQRTFSLMEPYPDKTISDFDYGFIDDEP